jgi:RTX calcium-binding nonapeptide repeat (4 copies)/Matrixin
MQYNPYLKGLFMIQNVKNNQNFPAWANTKAEQSLLSAVRSLRGDIKSQQAANPADPKLARARALSDKAVSAARDGDLQLAQKKLKTASARVAAVPASPALDAPVGNDPGGPTPVASAPVASGSYVKDYTGVVSSFSLVPEGAPKGAAFVTYSFEETPQSHDAYLNSIGVLSTFRPFTETMRTSVREAMAEWTSVAGVAFIEVPAGQGEMRIGSYDLSQSKGLENDVAFGDYPGRSVEEPLGGKGIIDLTYNYANNFDSGATFMKFIFMHEIGHMIGLKHPFDDTPVLDPVLDFQFNTVMSYRGNFLAEKLGTLDVDAGKSLYGSASDLTPGSWSWSPATNTLTRQGDARDQSLLGTPATDVMKGGTGNEYIATFDGADNIKGGNGNDRIFAGAGNDRISSDAGRDQIYGGIGNDILSGGAGADTLRGGKGNDVAVFSGKSSSYDIKRTGKNSYTVTDKRAFTGGRDVLIDVEKVRFSDKVVDLSRLPRK